MDSRYRSLMLVVAAVCVKVRSAKCLYLWKCGTRDED